MSRRRGAAEPAVVVSGSPWLRRRLRGALAPLGVSLEEVSTSTAFARHRRQRPFLLCFLDARGPEEAVRVTACLQGRPRERFVLIVGCWQGAQEDGLPGGGKAYGFLREPFGRAEVQAWARRAVDESRLVEGDQSLEDLLEARFRAFLGDLGPQPASSLHGVILEMVERPLLRAVLEWTAGNQSRAAEVLGIHRNTLRTKIRSLGLDLSEFET